MCASVCRVRGTQSNPCSWRMRCARPAGSVSSANRAASSSSGRSVGVMITIARCRSPVTPRRSAGSRPARTTEDLPLPEGPITARKRRSRSLSSHWVSARVRRKTRRLFPGRFRDRDRGRCPHQEVEMVCQAGHSWSWRDAFDATDQTMERVGIVAPRKSTRSPAAEIRSGPFSGICVGSKTGMTRKAGSYACVCPAPAAFPRFPTVPAPPDRETRRRSGSG